MRVSFKAEIPVNINPKYKTKESRKNTVGVLGSSKSTDEIMNYMELCASVTKSMVCKGKNLIHGCGNSGIMGTAYNAGKKYSKKDFNGRPIQNLAIIAQPLWGDEDLDNCVVIDEAKTEADRLDKFMRVSDNFLIFPGGITTMQESTTLIQENRHNGYYKKIVLFGEIFWSGLIKQYEYIYKQNIVKENPLGKEFIVANSISDVIKIFIKTKVR